MKNKPLPELLSPAGSPEAFNAAIAGGADAIYLGGSVFNARANAVNFTDSQLEAAVKKAHSAGVRVYVTLNTLILEREYRRAEKYIDLLYNIGTDALITADLGLSALIAKKYPDFPLHASTQAGCHNAQAAKLFAELGFSRVVAAREMSQKALASLIAESPVEIEMFIHGALCVCHSGQCLMSSVIGGRSGNRGECAQPCRMQYNGGYPLSLRDSCLAEHITDIIDSGAASLKIEGRMKSPDYVYGVTRIYRKLLDERRNATEKETATLAALFSRGGFTDGYYTGRISKQMNGIRSENDKQQSRRMQGDALLPVRDTGAAAPTEPTRFVFAKARESAPVMPADRTRRTTARFYDPAAIPDNANFDIIYLPPERFDPRKATGILMPPVILPGEENEVRKMLCALRQKGAEHILVSNPGHIELARESGLTLHADLRFNIYSTATKDVVHSLGFADELLSPELTLAQIRDIKGDKGVIVYGRLPLMLLEKRLGTSKLTDRRRVDFPVIREGKRDVLFNSCPVWMADKDDALDRAGINHRHFIFTTETKAQAAKVISDHKKHKEAAFTIRRIKN